MDLDAILDQALDEFEGTFFYHSWHRWWPQTPNVEMNAIIIWSKEGQLNDEAARLADKADISSMEEKAKKQETPEEAAEHMYNLMQEMEDPRYGEVLQGTLRNLSATNEGNQTVEGLFKVWIAEISPMLSSFMLLSPHSPKHVPSFLFFFVMANV